MVAFGTRWAFTAQLHYLATGTTPFSGRGLLYSTYPVVSYTGFARYIRSFIGYARDADNTTMLPTFNACKTVRLRTLYAATVRPFCSCRTTPFY